MMRTTHTYVTLEVSASAYDEIAAKLREAEYDHVFDAEEGAIDMHGIGLVKSPESALEAGHVIVRRDDTGVMTYWTGKAEWAFSIEHADAVRFGREQDAQMVLDNVVLPSEGSKLHRLQFPQDRILVELHTW
jgi:hypothetical protein